MRGLLLAVLLTACTHAASPSPPRARVIPARCGDGRDDTRYQSLCALLSGADSIGELLPLLDDDLRSNFTLTYATRGPERDVDARHPRVILFGRDARLVLAFTGDPAGANRDVVDVIHFRPSTRRFELERFVLPAAARRDPALAVLARDNGRADPVECRRCHGSDPRPIFSSYSVWPGFYGSVRDRMASAELAAYQDFAAHRTGVYAQLHYATGSPVAPYGLESAQLDLDAFAPNLRLGLALSELERARVARLLEASPRYEMYRDKLLAGLLGCERLPITAADRARVRAALAAENDAKLDRAHITDRDQRDDLHMAETVHLTNMAELDFVARVLDVGMTDWSLELAAGSLALFDGVLSGDVIYGQRHRDFYFKEDVVLEMMRRLAASDPDVAPYFSPRPYYLLGRLGSRLDVPRAIDACDLLARRSAKIDWPELPAPAPAVANRCVRCHEPGGVGPPIPFASPTRLAAALADRPTLAGAIAARTDMPLGEPRLSASEREQLLAYVAGGR